jgi:hypothetical protein
MTSAMTAMQSPRPGSEINMKVFTRRAALAIAATAFATPSIAQGNAPKISGRDLSVEVAHRRGRAINVSIMPVGPSSTSIGTPLTFRMVATADGWGSLYVFSASGRTQTWFENVRLRAGEPMTFPRRGLIVRASPPTGDEGVMFVASRDRLDGLAANQPTTPVDLQYTHEGLKSAIQDRVRGISRDRWAFSEIHIRVHD